MDLPYSSHTCKICKRIALSFLIHFLSAFFPSDLNGCIQFKNSQFQLPYFALSISLEMGTSLGTWYNETRKIIIAFKKTLSQQDLFPDTVPLGFRISKICCIL